MIPSNDSTADAQSGAVPGLFTDPGSTPAWFGWAQDGSLLPAEQTMSGQALLNRYPAEDLKQGVMDKELQGASARQVLGRDGLQFPGAPGLTMMGGEAYLGPYGRPRSGSLDFGSDSSSASQSIPSSATSSNIHLPLDVSSRQQQMIYNVGNQPTSVISAANFYGNSILIMHGITAGRAPKCNTQLIRTFATPLPTKPPNEKAGFLRLSASCLSTIQMRYLVYLEIARHSSLMPP